jgi:hypothetical protein
MNDKLKVGDYVLIDNERPAIITKLHLTKNTANVKYIRKDTFEVHTSLIDIDRITLLKTN